jgi:hypothetical protein
MAGNFPLSGNQTARIGLPLVLREHTTTDKLLFEKAFRGFFSWQPEAGAEGEPRSLGDR